MEFAAAPGLSFDKVEELIEHRGACVEALFSGTVSVGLPWHMVALPFFASAPTRGRRERALRRRPLNQVDDWLKQPNLRIISPGKDHWRLLRSMIFDGQAFGPW